MRGRLGLGTALGTPHAAVVAALAGALVALGQMGAAHATVLDVGNPDFKVRFDNTIKYSTGLRVASPDDTVAGVNAGPYPNVGGVPGNPVNNNLNDGDQSFEEGSIIQNRLDLLSEFDVVYKNSYGFRVSAAAWYDDVYNRDNDYSGRATDCNQGSTPCGSFTGATERLHGQKAEVLDAFAFGKWDLPGNQTFSMRLGQFTQLYGESLFLGANGVAAAQGPIDIVKALSVPGVQFKEIGIPVPQLSVQYNPSPDWTVGAYYQFTWRRTRLPGAGSYFSFADVVGAGAEQLYFPPILGPFFNGGAFMARSEDMDARNNGQGGAQIRYKLNQDWEVGLYGANFHYKEPVIMIRPAAGDYFLAYPQDIQVYGASAATVFGDTNVSFEASFRNNQPLAGGTVGGGDVYVDLAGTGIDTRDNIPYPVGRTLHANISAISLLNESPLWDGAVVIGEIGFNHLLDVTKNSAILDPNVTDSAWGLKVQFEPSYFQVLPQLDITTPITLSYGLAGRSALGPNIFGPENGGSISIGVSGLYASAWKVGLQYTNYFGEKGGLTGDQTAREYSYKQMLADRDYVSLSVQTTF